MIETLMESKTRVRINHVEMAKSVKLNIFFGACLVAVADAATKSANKQYLKEQTQMSICCYERHYHPKRTVEMQGLTPS